MSAAVTPGNLSCNESFSSSRALVIEEDPVAGEHAVRLAVVDHDPVGVQLGNAVWRSKIPIFSFYVMKDSYA